MTYVLKNYHLSVVIVLISLNAFSQDPDEYYTSTNGKTGYSLKSALHLIIKDHHTQSYSSLWEHFKTTDIKVNGKVWDMYTDIPNGTPIYEFEFTTDQCGNYTNEGDCYNREHSWPKSWFNDALPMYSDLFHLYPTDGKVNGERGNYPFGEVVTALYTSSNSSKRGPSKDANYNGTVFEPIDDYKGDFARSYFYMATRYENVIANWEKYEANGDAVLNGTNNQVFEQWYLNILFKWHTQDPVSQKELDRNNAVYQIQGNRNPFIDHPEFVAQIWGTQTTVEQNAIENSLTIAYDKSSNQLSLKWLEQNKTDGVSFVQVIDMFSKTHIHGAVPAGSTHAELNLSNCPKGLYIVITQTSNGTIISRKLIIN